MVKNRQLVLTGPKTHSIVETDLPPPPPNHITLRILTTTLCGSDTHYYTSFRNGSIIPTQPMILGHEACAQVVTLGPGVTSFSPGDLVALEVGTPCAECRLCKQGRYNLCPQLLFRSSARFPKGVDEGRRSELEGTLQEYLNIRESCCHKLPADFAPPLASLLEPLSVALHAVSRANIPKDDNIKILILGCGPIGLLLALALAHKGLKQGIVMADINPSRVSYALTHKFCEKGVTIPLDLPKTETGNPSADYILSESELAGGFDFTFEATGAPPAINTAIHSTTPGGRVILLGIPPANVGLDLAMASLREIDLVGSFRYAGEYREAIEIVSGDEEVKVGLGKLVTHVVRGLEGAEEGFRLAGGAEGVVKVCVDMRVGDWEGGSL
ncbi:GroES-like protein [Ascobolus immersus RN42]|uniref:GroES-like protein n=1 Tax=Ascobolus immersus RN42 TaxID=1160509 RepID=A0A3N4HTR4_ASCIM|nr:GroES-like protein [Ascobolus immersus RN42]